MTGFRIAGGLVLAACLAGLATAPQAVSPQAAVARTRPVRLGCSLSLSGRQAQSGALYKRGYQAGLELVNASGGVTVGGELRPLELVCRDDGGDPARAAVIYEDLIDSGGADLLLGPFGTAQSVAAARVAGLRGVPVMIAGADSGEVFAAGGGLAFGFLPDDARFAAPLFERMAQRDSGPGSLALVYLDDRFHGAVASGARRLARAAGMSVTVDHAYALGKNPREPLVREILERRPSALLIAGHEEEARALVSELRAEGLESVFCLTSGVMERDFRKALGDRAEGILGIVPWNTVLDLGEGGRWGSSAEFAARFRKAFDGEAPDYHAAAAAASVVALATAVERAGGTAPQAVAEELRALSLETFYGRIRFDSEGRQLGGSFLVEIRQGEPVQAAAPQDEGPAAR